MQVERRDVASQVVHPYRKGDVAHSDARPP